MTVLQARFEDLDSVARGKAQDCEKSADMFVKPALAIAYWHHYALPSSRTQTTESYLDESYRNLSPLHLFPRKHLVLNRAQTHVSPPPMRRAIFDSAQCRASLRPPSIQTYSCPKCCHATSSDWPATIQAPRHRWTDSRRNAARMRANTNYARIDPRWYKRRTKIRNVL